MINYQFSLVWRGGYLPGPNRFSVFVATSLGTTFFPPWPHWQTSNSLAVRQYQQTVAFGRCCRPKLFREKHGPGHTSSGMTLPAMGAAPPGQATGPIHVFGHRQMRMLRSIYPPYSLSSLCISFLLLLFAHVKKASAQLDPINNFCRRFGHQTAIIDRRLYVDGGLVNYSPFAQYPNNYTSELRRVGLQDKR